jgi:hypothetical protein
MPLACSHRIFTVFFEVYVERRGYLFDATRMAPVSGLVRIGIGRDAADTSFANGRPSDYAVYQGRGYIG